MYINQKPFLIIISSPSGAGKSTICKMIVQNDPLIRLSISTTTRKKRDGEIEGKDYFFVEKNTFLKMKEEKEFIEDAEVFGNYYGTPKQMVEDQLKNKHCVLFDIDWQGARQIKEKFLNDEVISIFILPPSIEELERRLKARAQDSEDVVKERMMKANQEIAHFMEYDYILINDELSNCYSKIKSLIEAKRIDRQDKDDIIKLVKEFSNKNKN